MAGLAGQRRTVLGSSGVAPGSSHRGDRDARAIVMHSVTGLLTTSWQLVREYLPAGTSATARVRHA
ncbi:hypothetical protein ACFQZ4_46575 [Catellatospora coxensis]